MQRNVLLWVIPHTCRLKWYSPDTGLPLYLLWKLLPLIKILRRGGCDLDQNCRRGQGAKPTIALPHSANAVVSFHFRRPSMLLCFLRKASGEAHGFSVSKVALRSTPNVEVQVLPDWTAKWGCFSSSAHLHYLSASALHLYGGRAHTSANPRERVTVRTHIALVFETSYYKLWGDIGWKTQAA